MSSACSSSSAVTSAVKLPGGMTAPSGRTGDQGPRLPATSAFTPVAGPATAPPGVPAQAARAVVLDVTDHGPGLTPEQAQRVFERFYRADQARTRKNGGSGLGLAIVSALVSAHGGTATVQSTPGHGATFRIALPLAQGAADWDADPDTDQQAGVAGPGAGSRWR